jgi:hypothetical protein
MTIYKRWMKTAATVLGAAAGAWLLGCSGETPPSPSGCPATDQVCDVCAGVPAGDVCGDDTCAEGVSCTEVVVVASDAELASKVAAAKTGTCLALAPGHYGVVSLPGGVSLLGRSATAVTVDSITVTAGAGTVLRGLGVGAGGVELLGATGVRIESVRVTGSPSVKRDGIALDPGASATIVSSSIEGAGRVGVFAKDADVTLDRCVVSGAQVTGVWIEGSSCDGTCACPGSPTLTMKSSVIRDNHVFGLSTRGATANLSCTDVIGTRSGDTVMTGQRGGGVSATECSNVIATKLRVLDSADWGVLIDGSTAKLGSETSPDETVEISRNRRGLWVQNVVHNTACQSIGGCVAVHNGTLAENLGVGIGIAGETRGMIICKASVLGTLNDMLPVSDENGKIGGSEAVGDGVDWLDGSEVVIEALTLSGNQRQSLLIDGPVSGKIGSLTLAGGEEPILQQNLMGGEKPEQGSGVNLMTQDTRKLAVPLSLIVPAPL